MRYVKITMADGVYTLWTADEQCGPYEPMVAANYVKVLVLAVASSWMPAKMIVRMLHDITVAMMDSGTLDRVYDTDQFLPKPEDN